MSAIKFLLPPAKTAPILWVAELGPHNKLGVHQENGWCGKIQDQIIYFDSENRCMFLLPVLELGRAAYFKALEEFFVELGNLVNDFPESLLLLHAVRTDVSEYWMGKAVDWMEQDARAYSRIESNLLEILRTKKLSQKISNRFKRLSAESAVLNANENRRG
jgi:hypothetical protein